MAHTRQHYDPAGGEHYCHHLARHQASNHPVHEYPGYHTSVSAEAKEDGSHKEVSCPEAIVLYNKYMGGVDKGLIRWKKTARKTEGTPTTNYF